MDKPSRQNLLTLLKHSISVIIPICLYAALLSVYLPHGLGLSLRYDFASILPPLFLVFLLAFQPRGNIGRLFGLTVTLLCFALPLSGLWASGQSEQYLLGGLIPYSDADHYYIDATALLNGKLVSTFTARRPLFAGLLAVLLGITDYNLMIALAILVAICALACYLFAREIQSTHGVLMAVLMLLFLFLFYRPISGKTLTENLGLPLSAIGSALLWRSITQQKRWQAILGIFLVSLALNARAGAFFVLPMLVLWVSGHFRNPSRLPLSPVSFGIASVAVIASFFINFLVVRALAGEGAPFGNFAHTLYGFASGGKGWAQIYYDHDSEIRDASGVEQNEKIYQLALQKMRSEPSLMLTGAIKAWKAFFSVDEYSSFCFIGGENVQVAKFSRLLLYAFCLLTLIFWIIKRDSYKSLAIAASIGVILSVPFAPPIDANRMRAYAATIPLFALLPLLGFDSLVRKISHKEVFLLHRKDFSANNDLYIFTIPLLAMLLIAPLLIRVSATPPALPTTSCEAGQEMAYLRINPGIYINIVADDAASRDWLPNIRRRYFVNRVHNLPHVETFDEFDNVPSGVSIMEGINLKNDSRILLFIDTLKLSERKGIYGLCGNYTKMPNPLTKHFFYAQSIHP
ncbi:MAG: hypothetical protein HPY45_04130 [Anaerolineae bacterium]|nr:hypothetical protein [Anaerolineae bacterium]